MRTDLRTVNSALFVPANAEDRLAKALDSAADAVIVDLEDSVPDARKAHARALAAQALARARRPWMTLRVNAPGSAQHAEDLRMAASVGVDAIVLPKATSADVAALGGEGPPIWALVESAAGLRGAHALARAPRVELLALGSVDLALELNLEVGAEQLELLHARSQLVLDARAGGLRAPLDGVCTRVGDDALLQWECAHARALGFGGKLCVHPRQLESVARAFAPAAERLQWAHDVLAAYEAAGRAGEGAVALDGEMIDLPVVERARRLLRGAGEA